MESNERSGLQTAAKLAQSAKSAANIARAAAAAGLEGAAVAAVKESLPVLVKLLIGLLIATVIVPMLVFSAMPNIFFGYDSSETEPIMQMTGQAMTLGRTCVTVEEFERTYVDAIVTSLVDAYENDGISIDEVIVESDFEENDLMWMIAINSAAHRQNLNTMTVETVKSFCKARLDYRPTLRLFDDGHATLHVYIGKLNAESVMTQLGFDDDGRTWVGAMFETMSESDALNKYAAYYEAYVPDYSGDGGYSGDVWYGDSFENTIDISDFVSPSTKNSRDLAAYAIQAWENNWGYVWGTYGGVLTESLLDYKIRQYPDGVGAYEDIIRTRWLGRRTTDCIGLVKGYGWLDADTLTIRYGTNGMPDYGADRMYQDAQERGAEHGTMDTLPEIPGLVLWKSGHTGVYIGGGYAIEAMGTSKGVVKTEVASRGWQAWYKIPYIDYD